MKMEYIQLEENERVLLRVRKHWFVLTLQVLSVLTIALLPLIFFAVATMSTTLTALIPLNVPFLLSLYTAWLIIQWMALFSVWTNYYLDVWTVTDRRLIAVDQRGFFSRTTASFRLDRMQDITVEVHGIIATFLDYGTLGVQTAGSEERFKVTGMPNPAEMKSVILTAIEEIHQHNPTVAQSEV